MDAQRLQPRVDGQHPASRLVDASGHPHAGSGGFLQHSLPALPGSGWMGRVRAVPPYRARIRAGAARRLGLRLFAVSGLQAAREYQSRPGPDAAAGGLPHVARAGRDHAPPNLYRVARAGAQRAIFAFHRDLRDDDDERRDCNRDRAGGERRERSQPHSRTHWAHRAQLRARDSLARALSLLPLRLRFSARHDLVDQHRVDRFAQLPGARAHQCAGPSRRDAAPSR